MSNVDRQTSFASGELAPEFYGRIDQPAFRTGLRLAKNFIPTPRGALHSRPGWEYVAEVKDSSAQTKLREFIFSDAQTYALEFGNLYMRFVSNGEQALVPSAAAWNILLGYAPQARVSYGGLVYIAITTVGAGVQPGTDPTKWVVIGTAGTPFEVVTPWATADLPRLKFSQSGDVIEVTGPGYAPYEISRIYQWYWTVAATSFSPAAFGGAGHASVAAGGNKIGGAISNVQEYAAGVTYDTYRFVAYGATPNRHLYQSIVDGNVGNQPDTHPASWLKISWLNTVTYSTGDYAWDYADGNCYISLKDNNKGLVPSTNATWWQLASDELRPPKEWQWCVTMLWRDTSGATHESLPCAASPSLSESGEKWSRYSDRPTSVQWPQTVAPATNYKLIGFNLYVGRDGIFGLVSQTTGLGGSSGLTSGGSIRDDGGAPDFTVQPPAGTNPFRIADGADSAATSSNPTACTFHEQRLLFAGSPAKPGTFWGSMLASLKRFDIKSPVIASDPYEFALACVQLEDIRSLLSINGLLLFTGAGVWGARGVNGGVLSPVSVDVRRLSKGGASYLRPLEARDRALYVTAKSNRVRDLLVNWAGLGASSAQQTDLTHFARHLFEGYTITDWCYAEEPYSLVWAVRSDGVMLSLVYDPASQSLGWAQHNSEDGSATFESVCSVPEGTEDAVYAVVKRTVNGATKRYIERLASRIVSDVRSYVGSDSAKVFDFRASDGSVVQLQNYTTLLGGTEADVVSTASSFTAANEGDVIVLDPDGTDYPVADQADWDTATYYAANDVVAYKGASWFALNPGAGHKPDVSPTWWSRANGPFRATIQSFTDVSTVHVILDNNIGPFSGGTWTTKWGIAPRVVTGLDHLEGKTVAVLGDGTVQGQQVVGAGQITLETPAIDVVVGLPITCDAELLDVPVEQVKTNVKSVSRVNVEVVVSRGFWAGEDFDNLKEKGNWRRVADSYGLPQLKTDSVPMAIESGWNTGGRVAIRQTDPLPLSIVALTREFEIGGRDR